MFLCKVGHFLTVYLCFFFFKEMNKTLLHIENKQKILYVKESVVAISFKCLYLCVHALTEL